MLKPVIHSHIHDAGYRWPVVASLIGHTLLLLFCLFAVKIFPAGEPLLIGSGRPALTLDPILSLQQALRPPCRHFHLGDDILFDLDLRSRS